MNVESLPQTAITASANLRLYWMGWVNVVGIVVYLGFASRCWIEPELANVPGASGGAAFVWALTALPVLFVFVAINLVWLLVECWGYLGKRPWRLALTSFAIPVFAVPIAWAIAILIDFSQHGM